MPEITSANVEAVAAFVDEVVEEAIGISHKKWALIVVAILGVTATAIWLTRRRRSLEPTTTLPTGDSS